MALTPPPPSQARSRCGPRCRRRRAVRAGHVLGALARRVAMNARSASRLVLRLAVPASPPAAGQFPQHAGSGRRVMDDQLLRRLDGAVRHLAQWPHLHRQRQPDTVHLPWRQLHLALHPPHGAGRPGAVHAHVLPCGWHGERVERRDELHVAPGGRPQRLHALLHHRRPGPDQQQRRHAGAHRIIGQPLHRHDPRGGPQLRRQR